MSSNCDVYPRARFHVKLLNSSKTWVENGLFYQTRHKHKSNENPAKAII